MSLNEQEIIHKLKAIESTLQSQQSTIDNLKEVVQELKNVVQDLDKTDAIQAEKLSHLFYRVERLQKEIEALDLADEKASNRQRDLVEKALMAFLGAVISYIFSVSK